MHPAQKNLMVDTPKRPHESTGKPNSNIAFVTELPKATAYLFIQSDKKNHAKLI